MASLGGTGWGGTEGGVRAVSSSGVASLSCDAGLEVVVVEAAVVITESDMVFSAVEERRSVGVKVGYIVTRNGFEQRQDQNEGQE